MMPSRWWVRNFRFRQRARQIRSRLDVPERLIGCTVFDGEQEVGKIEDVQFGAGEAPLLVVRGEGQKVEQSCPTRFPSPRHISKAGSGEEAGQNEVAGRIARRERSGVERREREKSVIPGRSWFASI